MNIGTSMVGGSPYGAYRKSKMIIDILNVILTAAIVGIFAALVVLGDRRDALFPVLFLVGGVDNGLVAAKSFMSGQKPGGILLSVVTAGLLFLALVSFRLK